MARILASASRNSSRRSQARIGLVLRVSPIDAADIPAKNFECGNAVFFGVGSELGQFTEAMRNHVFAVGQDDGLPCIFFAQPVGRAANREVLVEP